MVKENKEIFEDIWGSSLGEMQLNIPMVARRPSALMLKADQKLRGNK